MAIHPMQRPPAFARAALWGLAVLLAALAQAQARSVVSISGGTPFEQAPPEAVCLGDAFFCTLRPVFTELCEPIYPGATVCLDFMRVPETAELAGRVQTALTDPIHFGLSRTQVGDAVTLIGRASAANGFDDPQSVALTPSLQGTDFHFLAAMEGPLLLAVDTVDLGAGYFFFDGSRSFEPLDAISMPLMAGQIIQVSLYQGVMHAVPEPGAALLAGLALFAAAAASGRARSGTQDA